MSSLSARQLISARRGRITACISVLGTAIRHSTSAQHFGTALRHSTSAQHFGTGGGPSKLTDYPFIFLKKWFFQP